MGTPADQRLLELLDQWRSSLELHLKYASLDDESYAQIQPWPAHQRPTRWIIELATQRLAALREQVTARIQSGDAGFSESLEHMIFLANLVGARHIERSIPMAEAELERDLSQSQSETPGTGDTVSQKKFPRDPGSDPAAGETAQVARSERKGAGASKLARKPTPKHGKPAGKSSTAAPPGREPVAAEVREQVLADAERLLQWGRQWFELAEIISRMADRPPLPDVRRILSENKTVIDARIGRG
jgi:hypothetical protein